MDAEAERDLVRRAKGGNRDATTELMAAHDGFCWLLARRFAERHPYLLLDDCVQTARVALLDSLASFDPDRDIRFLTYAGLVVRQRINGLRRTHSLVPPPARDWTLGPVVVFFTDLDVRYDGHPFDVPDRPAPDDWPWPVDRRDLLSAVNRLREPDRTVLRARLDGETNRAIGVRMGRTHARIQQIEDRASTTVARALLRLADRRVRGPVRRKPRTRQCPAS